MKVTICPSESLISSSTALSRSSNSPRYLAPATMDPRSREISVLPRSDSGTSPATMRWARPSTTAVLPTPGSPIRTGLFLVRRDSTCTTRRISESRPMTGSSLPSRAMAVRSAPNFSSAWKVPSGLGVVTRRSPLTDGTAVLSCSGPAPAPRRISPTFPSCWARPYRRCSVEMYSSPRDWANCSAAWMTCSAPRLNWAWAVEEPDAEGRALMAALACAETASTSAPVAFRTATATPSRWSMRALRRWAGSTCGLPAVEALVEAAESASWDLVVNLVSTAAPWRGTFWNGSGTNRPGADHQWMRPGSSANLSLAHSTPGQQGSVPARCRRPAVVPWNSTDPRRASLARRSSSRGPCCAVRGGPSPA